MTVEVNLERWGVELTYDKGLVQGLEINVRAENPSTGDVSTRDGLANDGRFVWTYPLGFTGTTMFTVAGSEGGKDEGTVTIGLINDAGDDNPETELDDDGNPVEGL